MKIGIVSPYLDSLGGGERYMLAIASHLSILHTVDVFWDNPDIVQKAQERFKLELSRVSVVPNVFAGGSVFQKLQVSRAYDLIFFLTDGSIPVSMAKHNILHMQVPFSHIDMPFWKKWRFDAVIYNSEFTRKHVDSVLHSIPGQVVYPPVDPIQGSVSGKLKLILSVGRFGGAYNTKKFDVLISAFEKLLRIKRYSGYQLAIAGGVLHSDDDALVKLRQRATGLPVTFYPNCPYETLVPLYEQASVYWHAAGYGETRPENMEHFGIAPVEAMSAGAVPVVFDGGGLPEIITEGQNGYLWKTTDELVSKTADILADPQLSTKLSSNAISSAVRFSMQVFNGKIDTLVSGVTGDPRI